MEITITINGVEYKFRTSAATTIIYKQKFGKDLIRGFSKLETDTDDSSDSIEMLSELAYVMACQAKATELDFVSWLEQFTTMQLFQEILPPIARLWRESNRTTSTPKNQ